MFRKFFWRLFCTQHEKTWFYEYVYDCSVDYDAFAVDEILDIHKYLMKKNNIWAIR